MLKDITNYFQMTDLVATSGQPNEAQFADIAAAGFEVVMNLAMPTDRHAVANEGSIVSTLGMTFVHIPVPWDAPKLEHLNRFIALMKAFEPAKVWVHCVVNARVSAFNYHYMKESLGLPVTECRSPLLDKWEPDMDTVWRNFLDIPASSITALREDS